jgi:rhodanese-related sulfurtransferase
MRKKIRSLSLALAALLALACRADTSGLATLEVTELAALLEEGDRATLCDANSDDTRARYGVIPGATLLTSYRDYDPATELPPDRGHALVFYCHSEFCSAAAEAARKAVAAGHRNVAVMPAGVRGWTEAGLPVDHPRHEEEPS